LSPGYLSRRSYLWSEGRGAQKGKGEKGERDEEGEEGETLVKKRSCGWLRGV